MTRRALALTLVLAVAACGGDETEETRAPPLPQGSEHVELDPAEFVAEIDHPYWPMSPGSRWVYEEDGQRVEVTVLSKKKTIAGIDAAVVHDVVTEDGSVIEDTYDWYAQDRSGNLWYLGEDTTEFQDGKPVSKEGSWEAGVDGAEAGVILPAHPRVGMRYRQEHYAGEAEDRGRVLSLDERAEVPFGSYERVLMTKDTTPLEPRVLEHKFYARGVGPVLVIDVVGGGREVLVGFVRGR